MESLTFKNGHYFPDQDKLDIAVEIFNRVINSDERQPLYYERRDVSSGYVRDEILTVSQ